MQRLFPYGRFVGLDSVASPEAMDERYLQTLRNAYVDFRGQIIKAPGIVPLVSDAGFDAVHVRHFGAANIVYYHLTGGNTAARSQLAHQLNPAFSGTTNLLNSTTFAQQLVTVAKGQTPIVYNGTAFVPNAVIPSGGVCTTVLNRLVVADITAAETELRVSRRDAIDFTVGTLAADGTVINIRNQLSSLDSVRGLGTLEGDKLAVFCQNETLLYSANADINAWQIIRDFRAPVGVFGRNTIRPVGTDLFFASKYGVHSLRRAASGLTLETIQLSRVVNDLFLQLVASVPAGTEPSAAWNGNTGQYQMFFPQPGGRFVQLVFTYEPATGRGGFQSWSTRDFRPHADASFFDNKIVYATRNAGLEEDHTPPPSGTTAMQVRTGTLWQGAPDKMKQYDRLIVRSTGSARYTINVYNQDGRLLQSSEHQPSPPSPFDGPIPTTSVKPISIKCRHRAFGVQLEFVCANPGELKILDFALSAGR